MKSSILFLLWIIPFVSFCQKDQHFFRLSGQLVNIKEGVEKVYLSYRKGKTEIIDSADVRGNKYYLIGKTDEPLLAIIQPRYSELKGNKFQETNFLGQAITVFLEPGNISLTSTNIFDSFTVKGSLADIEYRKLSTLANPYYNELQKLDREYDVNKNIKEKDSIDGKRFKLYHEMKDSVFLKFLKDNPKSVIAMYILGYYTDETIDVEKVKPLYDVLPKSIRDSPSGRMFKRKIDNVAKLAIMQPAINFIQKDKNGKIVKLNSFQNKYVLLDFWASWCSPCREQNPTLKKVFKKFKNKGFKIISVSLDSDKRNWLNAISKDQMTWVNISNLKGWANPIAINYNIETIPQNFLINPQGIIIAKNIWGDKLEEKLIEIYNTIK